MGSNGPIGHHSAVNTWGETIVIGRKGSFGKVHYSSVPVFVMDTAYFVDRRSSAAIIEWLAAALRWLPLDQNSRDSAVPGLDREEAHGYFVPYPPLEEQAAIVKYLGHANARIDRAIAAKRKLIALLDEQKQAIINQAVTRGLDPNVPMKDSGIPWLGPIPAPWQVARIKDAFRCLNALRVPLSSEQRGAMVSRQFDYYGASGVIDKVDNYLFDEPLILLAEDGANLVSRNLPLAILARGRYWVNNHAHILRPKSGSVEFLAHRLELVDYRPWISGAAQPKLTRDRFMSIPIAVPPLEEQNSIVAFLKSEAAPSDFVISRANREIELLREFRTRLTADVVTGQLDVREAAARLPELDPDDLVSDDVGTDEQDLDTELAENLEEVDA